MHFDIIRIEKTGTPESKWEGHLPLGDPTLKENTDYYEVTPLSKKERQGVIDSKWLKILFDGIADVSSDGTITVRSKDEVVSTLNRYYLAIADNIQEAVSINNMSPYYLTCAAKYYNDFYTMFYFEDRGYTSLDFIDEMQEHAGETFQIGHIFDAHW